MSDAQQFLVSKPAGTILLTSEDITDAVQAYGRLGSYGLTVDELTVATDTVATALPWRVIRDGRTVAAVEDSTKALAVLHELADDLTQWRLEFHTAAI